MNDERHCTECGAEMRRFEITYLCAARECPCFLCIGCWDAHRAMHILGRTSNTFVISFEQTQNTRVKDEMKRRGVLSTRGKQASAS